MMGPEQALDLRSGMDFSRTLRVLVQCAGELEALPGAGSPVWLSAFVGIFMPGEGPGNLGHTLHCLRHLHHLGWGGPVIVAILALLH